MPTSSGPEREDQAAGSGPLERLVDAYREAVASGALVDTALLGDDVPTAQLRELVANAIRSSGRPAGLTPHTVLAQRYELLEAIGSGGTGQVWRARDARLDREVAVKVLTSLASAALDVDRLIEREGRLLAKLDHPGAVRVQDAGCDGEHRFLVMDLVGGVGLADALRALEARRAAGGGALTGSALLSLCGAAAAGADATLAGDEPWPAAAVRLTIELLRTLEAVHRVGVVHRDLKPANIRVVAGGRPVLLDFGHGLVGDRVPGTLTAHLFGTAAYSAPEQWEGAAKVGPHTDVYQVGVVLYELLTLRRCFPDDSTAEIMRRVREGDYARPRTLDGGLPAELEACVLRAMELDPARRYPSAAAFRQDLERWLVGQRPGAARALPVASSTVRGFVRRNRSALALTLAVVVGAVAALTWSSSWPVVTRGEGRFVHVQLDAPAVMVAFRVREVDDGVVCTPVRIGGGASAEKPTVQRRLPAGSSDVELHDIGDAPPEQGSVVEAVFADAADPDATARLQRLADVLQQAGDLVDHRNGVWLSREEFEAMGQAGRGGATVDVPVVAGTTAQRWQHGGLRGIVVQW